MFDNLRYSQIHVAQLSSFQYKAFYLKNILHRNNNIQRWRIMGGYYIHTHSSGMSFASDGFQFRISFDLLVPFPVRLPIPMVQSIPCGKSHPWLVIMNDWDVTLNWKSSWDTVSFCPYVQVVVDFMDTWTICWCGVHSQILIVEYVDWLVDGKLCYWFM